MPSLGSCAFACWKGVTCSKGHKKHRADDNNENQELEQDNINDPLVWSKNLERHSCGEFSYAVAQANEIMEDHSQVETASNAIFVGVYDGHGAGPDAAKYISRSLFDNLIRITREHGTMSEQTLDRAVSTTEEGFLTLVERAQLLKPSIVVTGSCCLVGVIWKDTLLIAHLGECRAIVGIADTSDNIMGVQLTFDHNVNNVLVRQHVKDMHPDDPNLVVLRDGVWRVKDVIQVCRSIGDAYLKQSKFIVDPFDPSLQKYQFCGPLREPVLSAKPYLHTRVLQRNDRFLIFASHGLWEHLSTQQAAEIVHKYPGNGIARRLVKAAQKEAAKKKDIIYEDLHKVGKGERGEIHDDITVVVVFIDHDEISGARDVTMQNMSFKGFTDSTGPSKFRVIDDLML